MRPAKPSCSACLPGWSRPGSRLHRLCARSPPERQCDAGQNQTDMLHPIIFPAISNINLRLGRKMQSGVWKRVGPQQHRNWTTSNGRGSFSYLIHRAAWRLDVCKSIGCFFKRAAFLSRTHACTRSPALLIWMARPTRPLSPQERLYLQIQSYDLPVTESL